MGMTACATPITKAQQLYIDRPSRRSHITSSAAATKKKLTCSRLCHNGSSSGRSGPSDPACREAQVSSSEKIPASKCIVELTHASPCQRPDFQCISLFVVARLVLQGTVSIRVGTACSRALGSHELVLHAMDETSSNHPIASNEHAVPVQAFGQHQQNSCILSTAVHVSP